MCRDGSLQTKAITIFSIKLMVHKLSESLEAKACLWKSGGDCGKHHEHINIKK